MKIKIDNIRQRILSACEKSNRSPEEVNLIAVSKRKPLSSIEEAAKNGLTQFGENYIQEAQEKILQLDLRPFKWHFIGHLQSNKAKFAVKLFDLIHTVDSFKLAKEIDKHAKKINKIQNILIQVNIGGEESKAGIKPGDAADLSEKLGALSNISVKGLMTIPPPVENSTMAAPFFKQLKNLRDEINSLNIDNINLEDLSMGMTGDFETAISEGATYIRVGTAIFGERL